MPDHRYRWYHLLCSLCACKGDQALLTHLQQHVWKLEDEVRALLLGHMNWLAERNLVPQDVIDRRQDIDTPLVVDETHLAAFLLDEATKRGVEVLDDVDVVHVLDAHNAYFAAIGAVGPKADTI